MIEKRGIKIYDFVNKEDKILVEELLDSLIRIENLVPIIGTGFTSGLRTRWGQVPTAEELEKRIVDILCAVDNSDKEEFEKVPLKDLADEFWSLLSDERNIKYKNRFIEYIEDNFTKVFDVEQPKREFLNSDWHMVFTLNYDDTIENVLDTNVLIPYDRINLQNKKNCLIKLHGDAKKFALTGDDKYCVLGNRQYIDLIKDEKNKDLVRILEDTFFSKSIIFVGCGLDQELDILYSAGIQLDEKCKRNQEHHMIYLLYCKNEEELEDIKTINYKKYGITDIIKVNESTISELYGLIHSISKRNQALREEDSLKDFTNISFEYEDKRNKENIDYLFYNDKVNIKEHKIKLPSFFIERTCGAVIENEILYGNNIVNVVYGTSFSGKTYILLQLLKNLTSMKLYYFPSHITLSNEIIQQLIEKEDTIILIDDKAISFEQSRTLILSQLELLRKRKIKIVLAINKGDSDFYKYYLNHQQLFQGKIGLYELENKFNKKELEDFNECIGDLSLIEYKENNTILDYLFRADNNILKRQHKSILPPINFLSRENEKQIRALIVLVTRGALTTRESIDLGIDDVLYELANDFQITVQKDYLSGVEKEIPAQSGFKFILNSAYWVVKCLSSFASHSHNHQTIAKAYQNIVESYTSSDKRKMNEKIKEYYMLDKIQLIFSDSINKGSIMLPYLIYEELHTSLNWNCQFLHQEAKCELRMARRSKEEKSKNEILELAFRNITRALQLTEDQNWANIEITRAHMDVTKALILTNYVFAGNNDKVSEVISLYYDIFVTNKSLCPELEKDEMKDVKTFLGKIWESQCGIDKEVLKKFNEVYTNFGVTYKV